VPSRVGVNGPQAHGMTRRPQAAGRAMAFKFVEAAQARWRAVNAPHLVALVRAGARFATATWSERPDKSGDKAQAA
jgi:putative transposase